MQRKPPSTPNLTAQECLTNVTLVFLTLSVPDPDRAPRSDNISAHLLLRVGVGCRTGGKVQTLQEHQSQILGVGQLKNLRAEPSISAGSVTHAESDRLSSGGEVLAKAAK